MLRESFSSIDDPQNQSCSRDVVKEEPTSLPYSNFPVPFIRVSETVKRFKPGTDGMISRKPVAPLFTPSQTNSRVVDSFTDLELRLGINTNKSQVGENSETLQGSNLKNIDIERLPHPDQISGKRKRPSTNRPRAASANAVDEHLSQLRRKKQLLAETKPVESFPVAKDHISHVSVMGPPTPSVVLETTKQCILTFGADTALSWMSSRVSSLSSTGLTREGNAFPPPSGGGTPWEGLVASVQRQPQNVVTVRAGQTQKLHSSALDSWLEHFLCLYRKSLQQSSDDNIKDEFNAARFKGVRQARPLSFNNDFSHMFASNTSSDGGDDDKFSAAHILDARDPSGCSTPLSFRNDFHHLFASSDSTANSSGNDFLGQRSPFASANSSTMFFKDHIAGSNEHAADWSNESTFREKNDESFLREE